MLPTIPGFLNTMDRATMMPKKANKMTGVYIAPPKRCMPCIATSLLNFIGITSNFYKCYLLLHSSFLDSYCTKKSRELNSFAAFRHFCPFAYCSTSAVSWYNAA